MEYITKKDLIDCSTPDEFCFSLCCMECKTVWKSTPIRFSKAGKKPENENRKIIYDTLYDREKNLAFQKALNQAKEIFNICLNFAVFKLASNAFSNRLERTRQKSVSSTEICAGRSICTWKGIVLRSASAQ